MTSTNGNIGFADGERNSSRVLKPPGGGSCGFFDAADPDEAPRRRVDCNTPFLSVGETPTRATKPGNDTHNRLFGDTSFSIGEVRGTPTRATKPCNDTHNKLFGDTSFSIGEVRETPTRATKPGNDSHHRLFGEVVMKPPTPYVHKSKFNLGLCEDLGNVRVISADQDGNPKKAEGRNGTDGVVGTPRPGRVPPGGFSSGFW